MRHASLKSPFTIPTLKTDWRQTATGTRVGLQRAAGTPATEPQLEVGRIPKGGRAVDALRLSPLLAIAAWFLPAGPSNCPPSMYTRISRYNRRRSVFV